MLLLRDGVGWRDKYAACGDPGMAYERLCHGSLWRATISV